MMGNFGSVNCLGGTQASLASAHDTETETDCSFHEIEDNSPATGMAEVRSKIHGSVQSDQEVQGELFYSNSQLLSDRRAWVEHERMRHCIYCQKETAFWNKQLVENAKQPRKLWRTIQSVLGSGSPVLQNNHVLTADDLLQFFNDKVEGVRQSTGNVPVQSSLPPAVVELTKFELASQDDVMKVIDDSQSKSCALDPVPTDILKSLLPDILPFVTNM